jgi:hypothetical protein
MVSLYTKEDQMAGKNRKSAVGPINELAIKGGAKPGKELSEPATSADHDVTEYEPVELGDYIQLKVRNGYTCIVYPAGARIMLSVRD